MRIVVDSMIVLMLVGIVGGVLLYHRQEAAEIDQARFVHESLTRLHEAAVLHRVLDNDGDARGGYLRVVRPEWFGAELPINVLVGREHPWIDVAPVGDLAMHPPDPVCDQAEQAGFWYNPNNGVFRARVRRQVSERQTLELYNRINSSALRTAIPDTDPIRNPVALGPAHLETTLASPNRGVVREAQAQPRPPADVFSDDGVITLDLSEAPAPVSLFEEEPVPTPRPAPKKRPTLRSD